jgi:hypothetical protein
LPFRHSRLSRGGMGGFPLLLPRPSFLFSMIWVVPLLLRRPSSGGVLRGIPFYCGDLRYTFATLFLGDLALPFYWLRCLGSSLGPKGPFPLSIASVCSFAAGGFFPSPSVASPLCAGLLALSFFWDTCSLPLGSSFGPFLLL